MNDILGILEIKCGKYKAEQMTDEMILLLAKEALSEYALMQCTLSKGGVTA